MSAIKVHELNKYIKKYISMDYLLSDIEVEGEISNFKHHSNGNMYLSLKDDYSKINAIVYSSDTKNLDFTPEDGDNVVIRGTVSLYDKDASLSLYIREMKLKGLGDLHEKFLRLKEALYEEGLFESSHKLKVPYFPQNVGVITSQTGAAIRDIINVLTRRNNAVNIILYPSNVQGDLAAKQLREGVKYFNENPVDLIILGRGGGGYEDLFAFNDEDLARDIYKSKIPIISAVGHEIDFVISDFVSDLRAPTPSAAAEMSAMSKVDLENQLDMAFNRLNQKLSVEIEENFETLNEMRDDLDILLNEKIEENKDNLEIIKRFLELKKPNVKKDILELEKNKDSLEKSFNNKIATSNRELVSAFRDLNNAFKRNISYESVKLEFTFKDFKNKRPDKLIDIKSEELEDKRVFLNKNIKYLLNNKKTNLIKIKDSLKNPVEANILIKDSNNRPLLRAGELNKGDNIKIKFIDGEVTSTVNEIFLRSDLNE